MAFEVGDVVQANHGPPRMTVVGTTDDTVGDGMAPGNDNLALRPGFARCLLFSGGDQEPANVAIHDVPEKALRRCDVAEAGVGTRTRPSRFGRTITSG